LKKLAAKCANPLARLHALWTLEGMDRLDVATLQPPRGRPSQNSRGSPAVFRGIPETSSQYSESDALRNKVIEMVKDPSAEVQLQLASLSVRSCRISK